MLMNRIGSAPHTAVNSTRRYRGGSARCRKRIGTIPTRYLTQHYISRRLVSVSKTVAQVRFQLRLCRSETEEWQTRPV